MALTREQREAARAFFVANELAPPYDRELDELQKILAEQASAAEQGRGYPSTDAEIVTYVGCIPEQPAQPPAGDALDAMAAAPTNDEWYEATTEHDARSDADGKRFASAHGVHQMLINRRARIAKPAEQTDEQKVEAILRTPWIDNPMSYHKLAAEIVSALKAGKQ